MHDECPLCHGNAEKLIFHPRTAVGTVMKLYLSNICHALLKFSVAITHTHKKTLTMQQLT